MTMELTVEQARKIVAVVHPNTVYYREAMKVLLKSVGGPQQPLQHPLQLPAGDVAPSAPWRGLSGAYKGVGDF